MEDNTILNDISNLSRIDAELQKINSLKESIDEFYIKDRSEFDTKLKGITNTFKTKLENNKEVSSVVDDFINEFVTNESLKDKARDKMFYILAGEVVGIFRGLQHSTTCNIL